MKSSNESSKAVFIAIFVVGYLLFGCTNKNASDLTEQEISSLSNTIMAHSEEANRAWQSLDAEAYMSHYSEEADFYFQGSYYSFDEFEAIVHDYLGSLQTSTLNMIDPHIEVLGPEGAVISYNYKGQNIDTTGVADNTEAAFTAVYKKQEGRWLIVQAHESMVPAGNDQ
ncbi:SgcJ/EcaC family oxidoreductase [Balneolaceae bacterium YR4-1]|uniref:SgcJ/EcaC family oxidoreductase n=1 Tax=Halalkalibaculum roseum TaxID=2709311 RepID=A0A6M1SRF8_9BACT|nr:SgcJ/EcaC family oxidoreductase [Halalkalibaculum roseum]NGP78001.1 SgcJ/EcaC family oxidoreductase [Halalkalibaculum roseum]